MKFLRRLKSSRNAPWSYPFDFFTILSALKEAQVQQISDTYHEETKLTPSPIQLSKLINYVQRALLCFCLSVLSTQSIAYYKCTDKEGNVSFQNLPCPPASQEEEKKNRATEPKEKVPEREVFGTGEFSNDSASNSQPAIVRSRLASVLASLSPLRMISAEYYLSNGAWPKRLKDIGIDAKQMSSKEIDAVRLGTNGGIVARLNKDFGKSKFIALKPKAVLGGTNLEWECFANFPKEVLSYSGNEVCESRSLF